MNKDVIYIEACVSLIFCTCCISTISITVAIIASIKNIAVTTHMYRYRKINSSLSVSFCSHIMVHSDGGWT